MPRVKTIIELLSEQPAEELSKMREANQKELARARAEVAKLELQGQLIDTALTKRGKPGRPGALTPEVVLEAANATASPMTAAEVRETLHAGGLDVNVNAVRNHLNRLVDTGDLAKDPETKRFVSDPEPAVSAFIPGVGTVGSVPAAAADDDIPF